MRDTSPKLLAPAVAVAVLAVGAAACGGSSDSGGRGGAPGAAAAAAAEGGPTSTACPPIFGIANKLCRDATTTTPESTATASGQAGEPAASPGSPGAAGAPSDAGAAAGATTTTAGGGGSAGEPPSASTTTTARPTTGTAPSPDVLPADVIATVCGFVRAAGMAPLRRGTPEYSPALDPDGNGLACE